MSIFGHDLGLIGKYYRSHTHAPATVTIRTEKDGYVAMHHVKGKKEYKSDDGKVTKTYKELFGDIPKQNHWL